MLEYFAATQKSRFEDNSNDPYTKMLDNMNVLYICGSESILQEHSCIFRRMFQTGRGE